MAVVIGVLVLVGGGVTAVVLGSGSSPDAQPASSSIPVGPPSGPGSPSTSIEPPAVSTSGWAVVDNGAGAGLTYSVPAEWQHKAGQVYDSRYGFSGNYAEYGTFTCPSPATGGVKGRVVSTPGFPASDPDPATVVLNVIDVVSSATLDVGANDLKTTKAAVSPDGKSATKEAVAKVGGNTECGREAELSVKVWEAGDGPDGKKAYRALVAFALTDGGPADPAPPKSGTAKAIVGTAKLAG
ncbi:hypothetical protein [Amycolatopsis minnesotensis]|uniref:hypothetical protein n=1 Tax=Amycolatopsis minnesotensis TaxID=337894 RepID=UPI0031D82ADC